LRICTKWLGESKDEIEDDLFHQDRDLLTSLKLVFFDTTSFVLRERKRKAFRGVGLPEYVNDFETRIS